MRNLLTFLLKHDMHKPSFVEMAFKDGNIRKICTTGDHAEPYNDEELVAIKQKEDEHYAKNWHKIIMPFMRYKYPSVAATDQYSYKNLALDNEDPLYFHVEMVKPGRSTFVVQHLSGRTISSMQDRILFRGVSMEEEDLKE